MRLIIITTILFLSACQHTRNNGAAVQDLSLLNKPVVEMNSGVKSLYAQAQQYMQNNDYNQAIASLERAYEIQPRAVAISQLLAEVYLYNNKTKQAYYWANIATKNSPTTGKTCAKSWRIFAIIAEQLGEQDKQSLALENQAQCRANSASGN